MIANICFFQKLIGMPSKAQQKRKKNKERHARNKDQGGLYDE